MAKENIEKEEMEESEMKPSNTEASEKNEPSDVQETENVINVLNEIDKIKGGKGEIKSIPTELHNAIQHAIAYLITIRDLYEDPLFKDVLDDMHDQRMEGQVPSLLVAVARNVPMEELQKVADEEGYEDVQNAVNDRISKVKEDEESEKMLYGNFDKSKKAIDDYCVENGYDEARKQKLYATINMLRDCFADGLLTKDEVGKIDKIDNYDSDIESIKSRIPANAVKVVLPDKASIDESMAPKTPAKSSQDGIGITSSYISPDYTQIGKRKIEQKNKRI